MRLNTDTTHPEYDINKDRWEFYLRSYMGGQDYIDGEYLTRYISESREDYLRRLDLTPFIFTAASFGAYRLPEYLILLREMLRLILF